LKLCFIVTPECAYNKKKEKYIRTEEEQERTTLQGQLEEKGEKLGKLND
jgi:hypothetical protein